VKRTSSRTTMPPPNAMPNHRRKPPHRHSATARRYCRRPSARVFRKASRRRSPVVGGLPSVQGDAKVPAFDASRSCRQRATVLSVGETLPRVGNQKPTDWPFASVNPIRGRKLNLGDLQGPKPQGERHPAAAACFFPYRLARPHAFVYIAALQAAAVAGSRPVRSCPIVGVPSEPER